MTRGYCYLRKVKILILVPSIRLRDTGKCLQALKSLDDNSGKQRQDKMIRKDYSGVKSGAALRK
jgi:hypothetical protein